MIVASWMAIFFRTGSTVEREIARGRYGDLGKERSGGKRRVLNGFERTGIRKRYANRQKTQNGTYGSRSGLGVLVNLMRKWPQHFLSLEDFKKGSFFSAVWARRSRIYTGFRPVKIRSDTRFRSGGCL
ncbi:hypothetical protein Zmor_006594 [Zophobas morio]|uniref:Uncharacterized protein n=1 Tax=Zophobas morio TaxID=2755281 RepID=A0AA38IV47_9CUCU|nr:hypothetical protein Zmor_006594 [Zophobas morio]